MTRQKYAAVSHHGNLWDVRRVGDNKPVAYCWADEEGATEIAGALNAQELRREGQFYAVKVGQVWTVRTASGAASELVCECGDSQATAVMVANALNTWTDAAKVCVGFQELMGTLTTVKRWLALEEPGTTLEEVQVKVEHTLARCDKGR